MPLDRVQYLCVQRAARLLRQPVQVRPDLIPAALLFGASFLAPPASWALLPFAALAVLVAVERELAARYP
jgi:hypothetical protein